ASHITTFDAMPCIGCSIEDLDTSLFKQQYLPKAYPEDVLKEDGRSVEAQMQSLGFFDMRYNCPTYAGIIFFGKNVERHLPGAYIQYVRFGGQSRSAEVRSEYKFFGSLCKMLSQLDTFVDTTIVNRRPIPVSTLREETIIDYPHWAMRELLMNAVCHRDYEGNGPIQFYQYDNRIEIINPGGLYGKATKENFPTVNDYRNPIIAEGMKVLGFVNRFSRGVFRVEEELKENGNGTPNFQLNLGTAFLVSVALSESALKYYPIEEVTKSATKEKNKASEGKEKDKPLNTTQTASSTQAKTKGKNKVSATKEKNKVGLHKEKNKVSVTKEKNKASEGKEKNKAGEGKEKNKAGESKEKEKGGSRKEKANQLEEAIIRIISSDSRATYAQLAKQLEFSESSIYSAIRHLKSIGRLRREGGRKLGRWIVINPDTK
ncbi:ATP-binding protein, partial [uncultured Porphyromonas sp.]|uniref:ATP-binding protein n=1 Tax=uncultured Porphyromonas sp. TaxID=159274 RepID=UPI0025EAAD2E